MPSASATLKKAPDGFFNETKKLSVGGWLMIKTSNYQKTLNGYMFHPACKNAVRCRRRQLKAQDKKDFDKKMHEAIE